MTEERILKRFEEMLALDKQVLATRRSPAPGHITSAFVDVQLANQWFTSSLNLISRVLGESSEHYQAMRRQFTNYPKHPNVEQAFGILEAARDDVRSDALFELKNLITAEVFDDFLEQGKALLLAHYYGPAAVSDILLLTSKAMRTGPHRQNAKERRAVRFGDQALSDQMKLPSLLTLNASNRAIGHLHIGVSI